MKKTEREDRETKRRSHRKRLGVVDRKKKTGDIGGGKSTLVKRQVLEL